RIHFGAVSHGPVGHRRANDRNASSLPNDSRLSFSTKLFNKLDDASYFRQHRAGHHAADRIKNHVQRLAACFQGQIIITRRAQPLRKALGHFAARDHSNSLPAAPQSLGFEAENIPRPFVNEKEGERDAWSKDRKSTRLNSSH